MKEEERSRLYARAKTTAGKDDMVSCIMKNFYHFSQRLYVMSCRDMICRDGNIDAAPASRIVEDLRERVDMYFKTVYDEKDSWPTEYGDKMQWSSVSD